MGGGGGGGGGGGKMVIQEEGTSEGGGGLKINRETPYSLKHLPICFGWLNLTAVAEQRPRRMFSDVPEHEEPAPKRKCCRLLKVETLPRKKARRLITL